MGGCRGKIRRAQVGIGLFLLTCVLRVNNRFRYGLAQLRALRVFLTAKRSNSTGK